MDLTLWQDPAWDAYGVPQAYRPTAIAAVTAVADTQPVMVAAALLGATGRGAATQPTSTTPDEV